MNKLFPLLLSIFSVGVCTATSIDKQDVLATPANLKELGLSVGVYPEPLCAEASDIEISIPASLNDALFSGATLDIQREGEVMLSTGLALIDVPKTIYSESPFHGVSFCLHPSLFKSASVRLFYNKGEFTTDSILLKDFGGYAGQ